MPPRYPVKQLYPEQTRIEPIALDALKSSVVQIGLNYWCELRGERRYPRRDELSPREIACALSNMVLVEIVRGGADYSLRLVGDEVRRAYPARLDHRLLSEITADMPKVTPLWEAIYRKVIHTAAPYAARVYVGLDDPEVNFSYAEVVCLPLGSSDEAVDHLLTFAAHTLEIS